MKKERSILETLSDITAISRDSRLEDSEKLQRLLESLCLLIRAEKASIMLKRGSRFLEVVASTRPEIIGTRQILSCDSPSCWVIRNKRPLYMDKGTGNPGVSCKGGYKTDAFFLAPIFSANRVMGVLSMTDKEGDGLFSQKDRETILQLAGILISAIENQSLTERLRKQRTQLEKKNRQLREYEKIRQEFFSLLVHDLKSPIAEVVANLDVLSYTTAAEENLFLVEAAQASCERMFRMVSNLLDITRLENRMLNLIPERLDASDLLKEALSMMHGQARIRKIRMENVRERDECPPVFIGDRGLLLRVFQNLLSNALDHSPEDGHILAGYETTDSKVLFYVDDCGPGIAPEDREKIFDKYVQGGERKGWSGRHSSGLGLNFCKLVIEAHKGRIFVQSRPEGGSSFRFTLSRMNL